MKEYGLKSHEHDLEGLGISSHTKVNWNLPPAHLIEEAIKNNEGYLADNGALMCDTGKFTGRSPEDKFIVEDEITKDAVWWGKINHPISREYFDKIFNKMIAHLEKSKTIYVKDAFAGDHPEYMLKLRVINTLAWHNLFCHNMFLRPSEEELKTFDPTFTIINAPDFLADPKEDGTREENFTIVNFTKKMILIGGSGYAGEMKKGIFSVLNFILPHKYNVLSMHCAANIGKKGDTTLFFGLSGTGKTTLSADSQRQLIGDDEHGWAKDTIFNFEGGCYAKVVNLSYENEPEIYDAIRFGTIVENTRFIPGTRTIDYKNISVTQNTRTAYPIHFIPNIKRPSRGGIPQNIFFLTCDSNGVLPPIAKLNSAQAMYHFISGYTAKVAGTEAGITEPQIVFSACFGEPFLPLHPTVYAQMLGQKMEENKAKVWLVNTGWSGGPYGTGSRIKLSYTRALISAALNGDLNDVAYTKHPIFGIEMPKSCPGVPENILHPQNTWSDNNAYNRKASALAGHFIKNFEKFEASANKNILEGAPKIIEHV